jgi:hypothetical protein
MPKPPLERLESHQHLTDEEYTRELLEIALRAALQLAHKCLTTGTEKTTLKRFSELTIRYIEEFANYLDKCKPEDKNLPSHGILHLYKTNKTKQEQVNATTTATKTENIPISSDKPRTNKKSSARKTQPAKARAGTKAR